MSAETMLIHLNKPQVSTEDAIANAMAVYRDCSVIIAGYKEAQKQAKLLIKKIIIETGQDKWETDTARCYITKPWVSVRYNTKSLDALIASDDNLSRLLSPHRKVSERAGTLTIRGK